MELVVLNSNFQPARLVEGYSSLIWTERFSSNGDFQLTSDDVGGTRNQLPLENPYFGIPPTIVSLRDSDVPMVVETHSIEKSLTDAPKITVTGRAFETVFDRRTTSMTNMAVSSAAVDVTTSKLTAVDAAYFVMGQVLALYPIPELRLELTRPSDYTPPADQTDYSVDKGDLYSWANSQITSENYGLRAIRPSDPSDHQITVEIYTGSDLTNKVIFDARFDQFTSSTYLLSTLGWQNVMQVQAKNGSAIVQDDPNKTYTGLALRMGYLDATSQTDSIAQDSAVLPTLMPNLGTVELAKHLETVLFDGEISRLNGYKYGQDFNLGDIVQLAGDYGLSQYVRVTEFIRSEDNEGEKAYPTFTALASSSS